jgi:undecaprenyl-diphosphatase
MDFVQAIDDWLFIIINGLAGRWPWLDALARLLLNDYFVPTVLALALLALWFERDKDLAGLPLIYTSNQRAVLVATLSAALANILLKMMNLLYFRPRPFASQPVNLLFYPPTDSSFPSNAATLGFAIAAGVWFYQRAWGWNLLALAWLFGLSRIFGGVHYPLDVVAGAMLGLSSAWLIHRRATFVDYLLGRVVTLANKLGVP